MVYCAFRFCGGSVLEWECIEVNAATFPRNLHVDRLVDKYITELERHMDKVLGENRVPLETRFSIIRTQETNVGNWLSDLMRVNSKADVACLNSGTIRSDCVFKPGTLRLRDLVCPTRSCAYAHLGRVTKHLYFAQVSMLPMPDELVVIEAKGVVLRQMIEVSVSQHPKTEGRFLQVMGFLTY